MDIPTDHYSIAKQQAETIFKSNHLVNCQAIKNQQVHFTSQGLNHIYFKAPRKPRPIQDQEKRLELLEHAIKTVRKTTTIQEYEERLVDVVMYYGKKKETRKVIAEYYGFISIINHHNKKLRIKVIVRRVGDGNLHFWSVIPSWDTYRHNGKTYRDISSGNVEED